MTFLATCLDSVTSVVEWVIDSGASQHMTNNRKYFKKIDPVREVANVEVGDGWSLSDKGVALFNSNCSCPAVRQLIV